MDETFRSWLITIAAIVLPILAYYRIRSQMTGEKLDRRQEGLFILFTLRPIGGVLMAGVLTYLIDPRRMAWSSVALPAWLRWAGTGLGVLGGGLLLWALPNLGRNLTDTVVTRRAHTLVRSGPYRWVRHPFYDAVALYIFANALAAANWFIFVIGTLAVTLLVVRTRTEEEKLLLRFGDSYRAYMQATGRFLPKMMAVMVFTAILTPALAAQEHVHPLPQKVGTVSFATSCATAARPVFNRAVALLHSFAFGQAVDGFNAVLKTDPSCAIAYWGIALSAWGNPFAAGVKPDAQLQQGLDAVERGRLIDKGTDREHEYVMAASRLYANFRTLDQRTRVLAYRDAMAALSARYPADTEASIFYALALAFSADPADKTYASQLKAGALLEKVEASQPDHPGLAHYIIHSYDVPALAARALNAARRYAKIAPAAPHALHMPSHTFTRVGSWQDSINTNIASAASARREGSTAEELHASDYLMYAYLQTGQDRAAHRLLQSLAEIAGRFDPNSVGAAAPPAAGYFAIAALPARYVLERGAWKDAATLEISQSPFPFADALTYFARALGAARVGDISVSTSAIAALGQMRDQLAQRNEMYWSAQVDIQQRAASAWLALAQGRRDEALLGMRQAAEREDATEKNAITPGPLAPARELLGEMLLELGEPVQALGEFERTLRSEPNRFRAVAGAAKASAAAGDRAASRKYSGQLLTICTRADRPGRPELADARRSLAGSR